MLSASVHIKNKMHLCCDDKTAAFNECCPNTAPTTPATFCFWVTQTHAHSLFCCFYVVVFWRCLVLMHAALLHAVFTCALCDAMNHTDLQGAKPVHQMNGTITPVLGADWVQETASCTNNAEKAADSSTTHLLKHMCMKATWRISEQTYLV